MTTSGTVLNYVGTSCTPANCEYSIRAVTPRVNLKHAEDFMKFKCMCVVNINNTIHTCC